MEEVTAKDIQHTVTAARDELKLHLTSGAMDPTDVAIQRRKLELMEAKWSINSKVVMKTYGGSTPSKQDKIQRWIDSNVRQAIEEVAYERLPGVDMQIASKFIDYGLYAEQVKRNFYREFSRVQTITDEFQGTRTEIGGNPDGPKLVAVMMNTFLEWFKQHPIDKSFLNTSPRTAMDEFLLERKDMLALYNFIMSLPPTRTVTEIDVERPLMVEAVELAVGFIPVVGNGIALYEAYSGKDLFGYRLTNLERGILAVSCLLPVAGRLVKGGRAMYTNARLVKLYGRDAAVWQRTVQQSARALETKPAMLAIRNADEALRVTGKVEGKVAKEAAEALPKVLRSSSHVILDAEQAIKAVWEPLSKRFPALGQLDEFAIRRVVQKGTNRDHIKGQLLEELLESYVLPILRNRSAAFALGLKIPKGATLEFIPGHLIRSAAGKAGRQITDGMLGYYEKSVFNIVGIFEAKAGRKGARELSLSKTKIQELTSAERKELRAFATDVWLEEKDIAEAAGKPFTKLLESVEKEVILDEVGGQIARDIERLDELADGTLTLLRLGGNTTPVKLLSATRTKFFAIVPKGVTTALIEKEIKALGYLVEAIGVPIHTKDLGKIAEELGKVADRMAL